jgi:hypothetical protein
MPGLVLWAPMLGGIWGGNVAVLMFGAFVAAFWRPPVAHDLVLDPRELDGAEPPNVLTGWLAAGVGGVKVSQAQAWLAVLSRSPRAALLGAAPWLALVLATLPIIGIDLYRSWIEQLARASDPTWEAMGPSLLRFVPAPLFTALTVGSFAVALRLRGSDTAVWLGIVMVVVTPNVHNHSALLLLPALLRIRREFALVAAVLIGSYSDLGWWLGVILLVALMVLGERWSILREPIRFERRVVG